MQLSTLLELVESGFSERVLIGPRDGGVTGEALMKWAKRGATQLRKLEARNLVYIAENDEALPALLFSAAWAGIPFVPLNYRLSDEQIRQLIDRLDAPFVVADARSAARLDALDAPVASIAEWRSLFEDDDMPSAAEPLDSPDGIAVVLHTSGTTAAPKAALLRHQHLAGYVLGSVEYGSADSSDAVLTAVPPYHVAGIANILSNLFSGRRIVYVGAFDPLTWLETVRAEEITHAMVVPTMLARIVKATDGHLANTPSLRSLAYGGARMPQSVLLEALQVFDGVDFVNAYGLTETSSTIAVLDPEEHRAAIASDDPIVRRRLGSVGRPLPGIDVEVRDEHGVRAAPGALGVVWVRGDQVSGEYASGDVLDADGWFCTRDRGWIDEEGFLFIEGRDDDVIIRGGENIAPEQIEELLISHPGVEDACVVGAEDEEWGQRLIAVVVRNGSPAVSGDELRAFTRDRLRGSLTPDEFVFVDALPRTDTGKLVRRQVLADLANRTRGAH